MYVRCYDAKAIYKCLKLKQQPEVRSAPVRGALHNQLLRERLTREQNMVGDQSRFSGVLLRRGNELSAKNQILRSMTEHERHSNVTKKRLKKNNTFTVVLDVVHCGRIKHAQDNVKTSDPFMMTGSSGRDDEKQAMFIICDFVESLLNYGFRWVAYIVAGFLIITSELVYSIKENWRRNDDSIMSTEEELMYYSMCSFCLRYQRLKLMAEQQET